MRNLTRGSRDTLRTKFHPTPLSILPSKNKKDSYSQQNRSSSLRLKHMMRRSLLVAASSNATRSSEGTPNNIQKTSPSPKDMKTDMPTHERVSPKMYPGTYIAYARAPLLHQAFDQQYPLELTKASVMQPSPFSLHVTSEQSRARNSYAPAFKTCWLYKI